MDIKVDAKQAKREFFKIRGRFIKLQRTIVAGALIEASEPIDAAAESLAPRATGQLSGSINPHLVKRGTFARLRVIVSTGRRYPKGRYQELGWKVTGRANRKTAKNPRFIEGKHFLKRAGVANYKAAENIFAARVFAGLAQIQDAGEAAGIV